MQDKVVQAMLFVKFNFCNFGDKSLISPKLLELIRYLYRHDLELGDDVSSTNVPSSSNPDASLSQLWHLQSFCLFGTFLHRMCLCEPKHRALADLLFG